MTQALAKGARLSGARIFETSKVTGILIERGRAAGVRIRGRAIIKAEKRAVNCAGMLGAVGRPHGGETRRWKRLNMMIDF